MVLVTPYADRAVAPEPVLLETISPFAPDAELKLDPEAVDDQVKAGFPSIFHDHGHFQLQVQACVHIRPFIFSQFRS